MLPCAAAQQDSGWLAVDLGETQLHANRFAPRCLPCDYTDPLAAQYSPDFSSQFDARPACPCTHAAICAGMGHESQCYINYGMGRQQLGAALTVQKSAPHSLFHAQQLLQSVCLV